jgi:hypothetical protein
MFVPEIIGPSLPTETAAVERDDVADDPLSTTSVA